MSILLGPKQPFGDLFVLETRLNMEKSPTMRWKQIEISGNQPSSRYRHSLTLFDHYVAEDKSKVFKFLVFGGRGGKPNLTSYFCYYALIIIRRFSWCREQCNHSVEWQLHHRVDNAAEQWPEHGLQLHVQGQELQSVFIWIHAQPSILAHGDSYRPEPSDGLWWCKSNESILWRHFLVRYGPLDFRQRYWTAPDEFVLALGRTRGQRADEPRWFELQQARQKCSADRWLFEERHNFLVFAQLRGI